MFHSHLFISEISLLSQWRRRQRCLWKCGKPRRVHGANCFSCITPPPFCEGSYPLIIWVFPLASVRQGSEPFSGKPFCPVSAYPSYSWTPRYHERVPIFWWSPSHIGLWRPYHLMKHSDRSNNKWIAQFYGAFPHYWRTHPHANDGRPLESSSYESPYHMHSYYLEGTDNYALVLSLGQTKVAPTDFHKVRFLVGLNRLGVPYASLFRVVGPTKQGGVIQWR